MAALFVGPVIAGGIVTNTNQSAKFTRMLCRDATLGIDAVYYNPAGLTKLGTGFHFSINNQIIGQTWKVLNNYQYLSDAPESEYIGKVSAPIFPSIYGVVNIGKFSVSAGFNPIGGGGGAEFEKGLPSFEMSLSDIVPMLQSQLYPLDTAVASAIGTDPGFRNITGYNAKLYFEGRSVYFGYQANVAYAINDMISVAIGGRLVTAKKTYTGYVSDITINAPAAYGGTQTPGNYLRTVAGTPYPDAATKAILLFFSGQLDAQTADREVDVEKTGTGFTPIVSINIQPIEILNIAVKYEHQTKLELETKVNDGKDGGGLFVDGEKEKASIPSQIMAGATLRPFKSLLISTGFHYYLDKKLDWEGVDSLINNNYYEVALGLEYGLTEKFKVSAGWLYAKTGVSEAYQSDQNFSLSSNTIGFGGAVQIIPQMEFNLGLSYSLYGEGNKNLQHAFANVGPMIPVTETYNKNTWVVGVGLDISLTK